MTANEYHVQTIIPLRMKLQEAEAEYRELYRKECGKKIGERARCKNCAYSCVLSITDHNGCMGGKCTCCNDWCYKWIPENDISKFLRKNYHYDSSLFYRLDDIFGSDFLAECNTPQKTNIVMEMLQLMARFDEKMDLEVKDA